MGANVTGPAPLPDRPAVAERTLVWIDARCAIIVGHRDGEVTVERIESDVPDHRKATGQVRHEPGIRHGGGGAPQTAGEPHRNEHLRRFVTLVHDRLPATDDLTILGPGTVRERLQREVHEADRRHHRARDVRCEPSGRLTERQLVARLDHDAGLEPRRRTVGAYRWSEPGPPARSGRHPTGPRRVTEKPVVHPEDAQT